MFNDFPWYWSPLKKEAGTWGGELGAFWGFLHFSLHVIMFGFLMRNKL